MTPRLTLLSRRYCHLCDDMLEALRRLQQYHGVDIDVDVVDIDAEPQFQQQYDQRVPVLLAGRVELCHYHLDADAVIDFLRRQRFSSEADRLESQPVIPTV